MFSSINNKNKLSLSSLDEDELNLVKLIQKELSESLFYISLSIVNPEIYGLREIERYLHDTIEAYTDIKKHLRTSLRIDQTTSRDEFISQLKKIRFGIQQHDENNKLEADQKLKINGAFLDKVLPKQKEKNKSIAVAIKEKSFFNNRNTQNGETVIDEVLDHEKSIISFYENSLFNQLHNQSLKEARILTEEIFRETICGKNEFSEIIIDKDNVDRFILFGREKYRPSTLPEVLNQFLVFGTMFFLNFLMINKFYSLTLIDKTTNGVDSVMKIVLIVICILLYVILSFFSTILLVNPILYVLFLLTKKPGDLAWRMVTRRKDVAPGSNRTYEEVKIMRNPFYKLAIWFFTIRIKGSIENSIEYGKEKYMAIEKKKRRDIEAGTFI